MILLLVSNYDWEHQLIKYLAYDPAKVLIQKSTIVISF